MALPLIAAAVVQVATKPWPWIMIGSWIFIANVDLGEMAREAVDILYNLWWLMIITISLLIVRQYLKIKIARQEAQRVDQ